MTNADDGMDIYRQYLKAHGLAEHLLIAHHAEGYAARHNTKKAHEDLAALAAMMGYGLAPLVKQEDAA